MTLAWSSRGFGLSQVIYLCGVLFLQSNSQFKENANLLWPVGGAVPGAVSPPGAL